MRFFQLVTSKEDSIQSIEHDLEKKERKRLEAQAAKQAKELGRSPVEDHSPDDGDVNRG